MPEWFENDEIWKDTFESMFPRKRMEAGDREIEGLLKLVHLPAGALLDLACGPGRHAIPLSKRGFKVTGVDLSPFLLEKARGFAKEQGQSVEFVNDDMRTFRRPNSFRSCVCLFSSFVLESRTDDLAVLGNVCENLQGDGTFVLDVLGKEILAKVFTPESESTTSDGARFKSTHKILNDWTRIENVWKIEKNGAVRTYQFRHNIYSGFELKQLLEEAGFHGIRLYGGFDGRSYDGKAKRLIAIAIK
ncbi:MAG: methyltransferase domain-containing protein [Verrucomicrobiia bacterium]|jgi:SAM-dependent methyltransferase